MGNNNFKVFIKQSNAYSAHSMQHTVGIYICSFSYTVLVLSENSEREVERSDGGPHCQEVRHGAHLSQGIITNRGMMLSLCETEVLAQWALDSPELKKES